MAELIDTLREINSLHGNSAVLRIFASPRFPIAAALIRICFINPEQSEVSEDQLCATLDELLSAARQLEIGAETDSNIRDNPRHYLDQWSNLRGTHWFSVHADPSGLKLYRLTVSGREAHTILASIEADRSVSTESRLKRFIDLANDLSARASGKPERRIEELRAQIARAEREIMTIERTGRIAEMPEREVIAAFDELLRLHGAIGADLDQVRSLVAGHRLATQDIVMTSQVPKGQLLDLVFFEEDKVRETDEYASLEAFRQLLTDDQLRSTTRRRVEELKQHPAIHKRFVATGKAPARFDGAVESFFDRSRRIDAEFTGYYEQLRSIVVREDIDDMRAVSRTHKSIGARLIEVRDRLEPTPRDARLDGVGIVLPGAILKPPPTADVHFPTNLASQAQPAPELNASEDDSDPQAFAREMRRQAYIDRPQLKLRLALARIKVDRHDIHLSEILALFPLKYGLLELSAYLEMAVRHHPSKFYPGRVTATRLIDEFEDPAGRTICTFFDPLFLSHGKPGAGLDAIDCRLPDEARIDPAELLQIECQGFEGQLRIMINEFLSETKTPGGEENCESAMAQR